jgi:hypothetical protein
MPVSLVQPAQHNTTTKSSLIHHYTAPQPPPHGPARTIQYGAHGSARWHIGEESLRIPGPTRAAFSAQEEGDWIGTTGC